MLIIIRQNSFEKYDGLNPNQIIDMKGLMGMHLITSLALRCRRKAIKLLKQFNTVEGVYDNIDSVSGKN